MTSNKPKPQSPVRPAPAQPAAKPTLNLTYTVQKGVDPFPFMKKLALSPRERG